MMARILVVDDATFIRKLIGDALASAGHQIVGEAQDGIAAVERFEALRTDLTTLDIRMPEKDGLAALAEIMAIDPQAVVVMCSAAGQASKVIESIRLGAKDFVVKPIQPDRLIIAVWKALDQGQSREPRECRGSLQPDRADQRADDDPRSSVNHQGKK
jgi:two-component system chemotaxis response regulator CheY